MYKRSEVRRQLIVPVEIIASFADTPFYLCAHDISPRGAFVESELMPNLGEHIICSFDLNEPYCFFGEVSRVNLLRRATDHGAPGFGIRFMDATPLHRLAIRHSLRGFPPPIPAKRRDGVVLRRIITV
jgi:hypothetical protein